jgi:hypothetical protein
MNGTETRIEFTASTNESYGLRLNISLPADAKKLKWVEYNCLIGSVPMYHSCERMGHLNFTWTIRDMTDGNWHHWETASKPSFEVGDGVGTGEIGWFTPVIHHRYVVTFKADPDVSAIRQSPANLHAYFEDERTQSLVMWGDLFSLVWETFAGLFFIAGLPLVLIFSHAKSMRSFSGKIDWEVRIRTGWFFCKSLSRARVFGLFRRQSDLPKLPTGFRPVVTQFEFSPD